MNKFEFIVKKPTFLNGVYCIIQLQNKKVYVGETKDVYIRFADHINCISTGNTATFHGSNVNLINEVDKKFWFYPLLDNKKQCINFLEKQGNRNTPFSQNLYDETIIMYLFRKYGFELYNDLNDNCGRNFFAEKNIDNLEKMTIDFIQDKDNSRTKDEIMESIKQYDEVVQKALREILGKANFEKISNKEYLEIDLEKIWNNKKTSKKYNLLNSDSDIKKAIKKIAYGYLDSEILEDCGIECIDAKELSDMINEGKLFDTTIFSKVGNYMDQLLSTILALKADDIESYGKCLWAFKGLDEKDTRLFLQTSSNPDNKKESKYIFLIFTPSKKHSGNMNSEETNPNESEDETFAEFKEKFKKGILEKDSYVTAKSVSISMRDNDTVKLSEELNESLKDMFPIIMNGKKEKGKNKSRAFVISKIWALDNYVNALDGIYNCFWRHTSQYSDKGYEKSYINTNFRKIENRLPNAKDINGRDCFVTFINHDKLLTSGNSSSHQCGRIRGLGKNNDTMENFKKVTEEPDEKLIIDEKLIKELEKNVTIKDYNAEEVRECLANTILSKDLFDEYSPFKNVLIAKLEYPYIVTLSDKEQ